MNPVIDTNILIDYLNGSGKARRELQLYQEPSISLITWMEVMVGAKDTDEEIILRGFLSRFQLMPLTPDIAETAVHLRREFRIRIPDAIIWATAQTGNTLLVTRNSRDFPNSHPGIRMPYKL